MADHRTKSMQKHYVQILMKRTDKMFYQSYKCTFVKCTYDQCCRYVHVYNKLLSIDVNITFMQEW